jgi:hypothetical protein
MAFSCVGVVPLSAQDTIPDRLLQPYELGVGYWENKGQCLDESGQASADLLYYSEGARPGVMLHNESRFSLFLRINDTLSTTLDTLKRVDLWPVGELATAVSPEPYSKKNHYQNFYTSNTAPDGVEQVQGFDRIIYPQIYPGIDLHFYSGNGGHKMSFVCKPGSNPFQIALQLQGQDSIGVDFAQLARLYLAERWLDLPEAIAYQVDVNNNVVPISWNAEWQKLDDDILSFVFGGYDPSLPLVLQIGPQPSAAQNVSGVAPCWGALFGGDQQEKVYSSEVDADQNYYVAGVNYGYNATFPSTVGSVVYGSGSYMCWLAMFDPDHELQWTIHYGGVDSNQYPFGLTTKVVAGVTQIYMAGRTGADNLFLFPQSGAYNDPGGSGLYTNGFILKVDEDGTIKWSTYFGNQNATIMDMDLDPQGRLIFVGTTEGPLPQPTTQPAGALAQAYTAGGDGFVVALDASDDLRWTSHIGGSSIDNLSSVRATATKFVVVGHTVSDDFEPILPGDSLAWAQDSLAGVNDLAVMEFDHEGALLWGTLIGGSGADVIEATDPLAVDVNGNIYILASVFSSDMPFEPGAGWYDEVQGNRWVLEFSGSDRSLLWSTALAPAFTFNPSSIAIDGTGNLFIGGGTQGNTLSIQELAGFYFQSDPNSGAPVAPEYFADGVLMSFTTEHWRSLSTYVGGDDWGFEPERIATLACGDQELYVAGVVSMEFVPDTSYFPVFFPGSAAWADSVYGGGASDGYVMAFCTDQFTAVPNSWPQGAQPPAAIAVRVGQDQWQLVGLADGLRPLYVLDASGRMVRSSSIRVAQGRSSTIDLSGLGEGVYLLRCVNSATVRVVVTE